MISWFECKECIGLDTGLTADEHACSAGIDSLAEDKNTVAYGVIVLWL